MNLQNSRIRTIFWILLGALFFQGCTSYHTIEIGESGELVAEVNQKGETRTAAVRMNDGYKYSATNLNFQADSSFWYAGEGILQVSYPSPDINKITFTDRKKSARTGLVIGSVLGAVVGSLFAYAMESSGSPYDDDGADVGDVALGAVAGAAVLGLISCGIGWALGHRDVYTITDTEPVINE